VTTVDPDQPGTWIDTILESLAGQVERCVDGVERWVSGRKQLAGIERLRQLARRRGVPDPELALGMTNAAIDATGELRGRYQETLRAIGAWLDISGFCDVRISEAAGELVIEAIGSDGEPAAIERIRLDSDGIGRLCRAVRNDRGSAVSYRPIDDRHTILDPA